MGAWLMATQRFRDVAWAEALIGYYSDHRITQLFAVLPIEQLHAQTLHRLKSGQGVLNPNGMEWTFLQNCPKPWSAELQQGLSKRVMVSLTTWQKMEKSDWGIQSFLAQLGLSLPVSVLLDIPASMRQAFSSPEHPLREAFSEMMERLEFRQKMQRAFSP